MRSSSYGSLKSSSSQHSRDTRYTSLSQAPLSSLTSHYSQSSLSSRDMLYNSQDIKKYIAYIEKNVATVSNDYYQFAEKYDKKMYNFINRHDDRTNKLFIDLRYREAECRRLNNKIEYICREVCKIKSKTNITKDDAIALTIDTEDSVSNKILLILCVYTIYVFSMVITY